MTKIHDTTNRRENRKKHFQKGNLKERVYSRGTFIWTHRDEEWKRIMLVGGSTNKTNKTWQLMSCRVGIGELKGTNRCLV